MLKYTKRWQVARLFLGHLLHKNDLPKENEWENIQELPAVKSCEIAWYKKHNGEIFKIFVFPTPPYLYYANVCELVTTKEDEPSFFAFIKDQNDHPEND